MPYVSLSCLMALEIQIFESLRYNSYRIFPANYLSIKDSLCTQRTYIIAK